MKMEIITIYVSIYRPVFHFRTREYRDNDCRTLYGNRELFTRNSELIVKLNRSVMAAGKLLH